MTRTALEGFGKSRPATDAVVIEATGNGMAVSLPPFVKRVVIANPLQVKAIAHVTGGGLPGNVPRNLPDGTKAVLDERHWPRPAIFDLVEHEGQVPHDEMLRTFNMGLGLVLAVAPGDAQAATSLLATRGLDAWVVGGVEKGVGEATCEVVR